MYGPQFALPNRCSNGCSASRNFEKIPPNPIPLVTRDAFKSKMADTVRDIQHKTCALTVRDLKRLLFRCASMLISTPEVRSRGIVL